MPNSVLSTPREAAEYLKIAESTVGALARRGALPYVWIGDRRLRRFRQTDLDAYIDARASAAPIASHNDDAPAADTRAAHLARASELIGLEVLATRKRGSEPGRSWFDMTIRDHHGRERTITLRTEHLLDRRLVFALATGARHIPPRAWTPTERRDVARALLHAAVDADRLALVAA